LVLGKNNCGKTSFLLILDKFLGLSAGRSAFAFDDFSSDFKDYLRVRVENPASQPTVGLVPGISLKIFIAYEDDDYLSNIGNNVIMDLNVDNKTIVLAFEYHTSEESIVKIREDYEAHKSEKKENAKALFDYIKEHHTKYFDIAKKSLLYDHLSEHEDDLVFTDLIKEQVRIDKIINFKWVSAKRKVSNKDSDRALSALSAQIYKKLEATNSDSAARDNFKDLLSNTDKSLNAVYEVLFKGVLDDVKAFGGIRKGDSVIRIVSSLQHRELLEENTTVMYGLNLGDHSLPENYNGLGYMSLISLIFEIKLAQHEFEKEEENPADINLLFVEEPEVHTHPQMQCVFIKNIKSLLSNGIKALDGRQRNLQTIITTHSSHIVSESNFHDIKYFKRIGNAITSKNLKDLEKEYGRHSAHYKFLKQYLTLDRSDLFFADKAIFVEGDTERILLPAMMKKLDQDDYIADFENDVESPILPLHSQNISVVEVGAYSQIFEKFMDFIGIKSVIITDIDSVKAVPVIDDKGKPKTNKDGEVITTLDACPVGDPDASATSNSSLKFFFGVDGLADLVALTADQKVLRKDGLTKEWINDSAGHLRCAYQIKVVVPNTYHARSFEDAFFHLNKKFLTQRVFDANNDYLKEAFPTLPMGATKDFCAGRKGPYELASAKISKPSLAMEILLNSTEEKITILSKEGKQKTISKDFSNWDTPVYIKEALIWLKND